MQNKYCGHCFVSTLNSVNIVAVTAILDLHVGNGRSEHVQMYIKSLAVLAMRACAQREFRGALPTRRWVCCAAGLSFVTNPKMLLWLKVKTVKPLKKR